MLGRLGYLGAAMRTETYFRNISEAKLCLHETSTNYRPLDPGSYLYKDLMALGELRKYSNDYIELVYTTLKAWNMDTRGAKLSDYEDFRKSIHKNKTKLEKLEGKTIKEIDDKKSMSILYELFKSLNIVAIDKPPLVTFSKTMHFFFPNFIVPIDRTYTQPFFHITFSKDKEKQFNVFKKIEMECKIISEIRDYSKWIDVKWNLNIPKIVDNLIIGYIRLLRI